MYHIFLQDNGSCDGHRDSVLGLAWNKAVRNILASASADCTVKVWDMAWPKCVLSIPHPDKVNLWLYCVTKVHLRTCMCIWSVSRTARVLSSGYTCTPVCVGLFALWNRILSRVLWGAEVWDCPLPYPLNMLLWEIVKVVIQTPHLAFSGSVYLLAPLSTTAARNRRIW